MKQIQKVWAELAKVKKGTNLSSKTRKVELNLMQDIANSREYLENSMGEASYIVDEFAPDKEDQLYEIQKDLDNIIVNSEASSLGVFIDELKEKLDTLEAKAKDLGMDADELYDEFDDSKRELENAESVYSQFSDLDKDYPLLFRLTNLNF
jgi:chaperonin cofactor prefoldin